MTEEWGSVANSASSDEHPTNTYDTYRDWQ